MLSSPDDCSIIVGEKKEIEIAQLFFSEWEIVRFIVRSNRNAMRKSLPESIKFGERDEGEGEREWKSKYSVASSKRHLM